MTAIVLKPIVIGIVMTALQIGMTLDARSANRTIGKLAGLPDHVGRKLLREGTFKTGSRLTKQVKRVAPRGRTGNFHRTIAKKDLRYAKDNTYVSLVGVNRKKRATVKQTAKLISKTGFISRGLSGQGKPVPLHFIERGTAPKIIRFKPDRNSVGGYLYWNIVRGDKRVPRRRRRYSVRHPGSRARPFVEKTFRKHEAANTTFFVRYVNRGVLRYAKRGDIR